MILVTGSTGTVGSAVARQLIRGGQRPRLLVRSTDRARAFHGRAELAPAHYEDRGALERALQGVQSLFLLSPGMDGIQHELRLVDLAKRAGVRRVVKLSAHGAGDGSLLLGRWHRQAEQHLEQSGLAWTHLRPSAFMSNLLCHKATLAPQGALHAATGEGRTALIDPEDVAAVAVRVLTRPGHEDQAYELTGPEALSGDDQARIASEVLGRPVRYVDVPPSAARDQLLGSGVPEGSVEALLDLMAATKAGRTAAVTSTVEDVLGRPGGTFRAWMERHALAFR